MPPRLPGIAEELRQSKPFGTSTEEAVVSVMRAAALVRRAFAARIEPHGLSVAQYNVLRILRGAGAEGLPTLVVRDRLIEEAPGITRLIDKLEGSGLVKRDRSSSDRRCVRCCITPAGRALLDRLDPEVHAVHDLVREGLADEVDQRSLNDLLARFRVGFREP
jgi:DNA-binding MarR family transcriptional regulator